MPEISIDEERVLHHTALNRQILIDAGNRPENFLGTDRFGNDRFAGLRPDGAQIWVQTREARS